jgi:hypothetical protein
VVNPELFALINRQVEAVTRKFTIRVGRMEPEHIRQVAWVAALENVPQWDPSRTGADGFFYVICWRAAIKETRHWRFLKTSPLEDDYAHACDRASPEERVEAAELEMKCRRLEAARLTATRALGLPVKVRAVGECLDVDIPRDVYGQRATVARRLRLSPKQLAANLIHYRRALRRSPVIQKLNTERQALMEEIRS